MQTMYITVRHFQGAPVRYGMKIRSAW